MNNYTHYDAIGKGYPLVLVHGLGGNLQSWYVIAERLAHRFRVYRYDLRGHGESHNPDGPWCLDDFVEDLHRLLQTIGIQTTHLAGFSLGGLIVQGLALRYPALVNQLAIISAVAGRTQEERERVAIRVQNLEQGDLYANIELAMDRWFTPQFRSQHPERVAQRIATLKRNDPEGYLNAYRVFNLSDLADDLHQIEAETLIMTGEDDPGSNSRMARLMHHRIRNSRLEILPGLRHSLLVEAPELVSDKLDAFFNEP